MIPFLKIIISKNSPQLSLYLFDKVILLSNNSLASIFLVLTDEFYNVPQKPDIKIRCEILLIISDFVLIMWHSTPLILNFKFPEYFNNLKLLLILICFTQTETLSPIKKSSLQAFQQYQQ